MLRIARAFALLSLFAGSAAAQNAPKPNPAPRAPESPYSQDAWLSEILIAEFDVPKDSFSGDLDRLVRGYQERLNKENADPREIGETIRLILKAPEITDPKEQLEVAKRVQGMREKGGAVLSEFFEKLGPVLKPTPEQYERFAAARDSFDPQMPLTIDPVARAQKILDSIPESLNLTPEQRGTYDEILANLKESAFEKNRMGEIRKQAEAARNAGQTEKAATLDQQAADLAGVFEAQVESSLDKFEGVLDPEQRSALHDLRTTAYGIGGNSQVNPRQDVKGMLRIVRRLSLDSGQRERVDELTRTAARTLRELGNDKAGRAALATQVYEELRRVLNAAQFTEFEAQLARLDRRNNRGGGAPPRPAVPDRGAKP